LSLFFGISKTQIDFLAVKLVAGSLSSDFVKAKSNQLKIIAFLLIAVGIALFITPIFLTQISLLYYSIQTIVQISLIPNLLLIGGLLILIGLILLMLRNEIANWLSKN
jgi:uncharacterized membrane protein YgdD (TMEM256/DUF423 family)